MGFLGILETENPLQVPATVILDERAEVPNPRLRPSFKHGAGKASHIVLIPQPSDDPNDPLNWQPARKLLITLIVSLGGCLYAATFGPLLNAGLVVIADEFHHPVPDITILTGYQLLVAGCSGAIASACSRKWGKRPVFIVSSLFGLLGSICGSAATNYNELMAARIVQGGGTAAYESIIISMVGDLYYVHERGAYNSAIQFVLAVVANFSSVITGPITQGLGWRYLFHLCVAVSGFQILLLFLFCPEMQYNRDPKYNLDQLVDSSTQDDLDSKMPLEDKPQPESIALHEARFHSGDIPQNDITKQKTFYQQLALYTGVYCKENFLQLLLSPFLVCSNLAVLWVVKTSGIVTATYVAQSFVISPIFAAPPYNLDPSGIGYLFLGPFIGGLIGSILFGSTIDPMVKFCARRNKGIYEPEYRLLVVFGGLIGAVGLFGFGVMCQQHASFYATATFHGLTIFGVTAVNIGTSSYALDAFRDMSSDIFVAQIVFKNFLFYGFSYFVNDWTARSGTEPIFYTFGSMVLVFSLTGILIFICGKRYRAWWARHNVLQKLHIKAHSDG